MTGCRGHCRERGPEERSIDHTSSPLDWKRWGSFWPGTKQNKNDHYAGQEGQGGFPSSTSSRCHLTHARSEALVPLYILVQRSNETKESTVDPHRGGQKGSITGNYSLLTSQIWPPGKSNHCTINFPSTQPLCTGWRKPRTSERKKEEEAKTDHGWIE